MIGKLAADQEAEARKKADEQAASYESAGNFPDNDSESPGLNLQA